MLRVAVAHPPPPHAAHERLARHHPTTFVLESRAGPQRLAQHSFVGWTPAATIVLDREGWHVDGDAPAPLANEDAQAYLRRLLALHASQDTSLPFVGGLVGCLSAGFAQSLEPKLAPPSSEAWPRLVLGLYLDALVYDHVAGTCEYVSCGPDRRADLQALIDPAAPQAALRVEEMTCATSDGQFAAKVVQAQELVRAGECFQIVLSRSWDAAYEGDLAPCYERLREMASVPYLYFLRFEGPRRRALLGASPEMLVRVRAGQAETFPIAGTRPKTGDATTDARLADELRADEKEGAEHAMLVDLARNDLSRVCKPGTVRVAQSRKVEAFRHVQHLVSQVTGTLEPRHDGLDALAAVFPAGTVSGAPKLRALEHIQRLEDSERGPYAGAVLYASFNGDLDSAITIRSLSAQDGRLCVRAGAGIVLGSDPEAEARETLHKAKAMLEALAPFASTGRDA